MGLKGLLKRLLSSPEDNNLVKIYLEDGKCGQKIQVLLRKSYDIQRVFEEDKEADYMINKVIICDSCFNRIKINVKFDRRYRTISRKIEGGKFLTEEEFADKSS